MHYHGLRVFDTSNLRKDVIQVFESIRRFSSVQTDGRVLIIECHLSHFDGWKGGVNRRRYEGSVLFLSFLHGFVIQSQATECLQRTSC